MGNPAKFKSSHPKTTIRSLPPELISQIVEHVLRSHCSDEAHHFGMELADQHDDLPHDHDDVNGMMLPPPGFMQAMMAAFGGMPPMGIPIPIPGMFAPNQPGNNQPAPAPAPPAAPAPAPAATAAAPNAVNPGPTTGANVGPAYRFGAPPPNGIFNRNLPPFASANPNNATARDTDNTRNGTADDDMNNSGNLSDDEMRSAGPLNSQRQDNSTNPSDVNDPPSPDPLHAQVNNAAPSVDIDVNAHAADTAESSDEEMFEPDEGNDSEWEDEDSDFESDAATELDHVTYPDGLPLNPLLPLLFVSRVFLHAVRAKLYKKIGLHSGLQASLLLKSLTAETSAAYVKEEGEEQDLTSPQNNLSSMVKSLILTHQVTLSAGRGGAQFYFDVIKNCPNLQDLVIKPDFLQSFTQTFFGVLSGLKLLESVALSSGMDAKFPLRVTTSRVNKLMRENWPNLRKLTVDRLEGTDEEIGREDVEDKICATVENSAHPGLTQLRLHKPNCTDLHLGVLLQHSAGTLTNLTLSFPTAKLDRTGFARLLLKFGYNLKTLRLDIGKDWHSKPKPSGKTPVTRRPEDYIDGQPASKQIEAIAAHAYFLDAVLPFLPKLEILDWEGNLASTNVFAQMPECLDTVIFGQSPGIQPGALAKLLRGYSRTKKFTQPDGTISSQVLHLTAAPGLKCLTVNRDDLKWTNAEIEELKRVCKERENCLHLSGEQGFPPVGPRGVIAFGGGMAMQVDIAAGPVPAPAPGQNQAAPNPPARRN